MSNVYQLFPKKARAEKPSPVMSTSKEIIVVNTKTGGVSNLMEEREYLHKTIDSTLSLLHTMSPHQKQKSFESLGDAMKQIFDLYIQTIRDAMEKKQ